MEGSFPERNDGDISLRIISSNVKNAIWTVKKQAIMLRTIFVGNLAVRIIVLDDYGGFRNIKGCRERLLVIPSPASICLLPWAGPHYLYENQPFEGLPNT